MLQNRNFFEEKNKKKECAHKSKTDQRSDRTPCGNKEKRKERENKMKRKSERKPERRRGREVGGIFRH